MPQVASRIHSQPTPTTFFETNSALPVRFAITSFGRVVSLIVGVALTVGAVTYERFQPAGITLGPGTTLYFREPTLSTRVHEAIHRRQMRDESIVGRLVSALRYPFDYRYRLEEEAEAKAGELCLQIHRFSSELPAYTTARSRAQAAEYRAWAWERIGVRVPDRVGHALKGGERCSEILREVTLDLPPGTPLSDDDAVRLATLRFLQSYGSSGTDVRRWRARLELADWADPVGWQLPPDVPDFGILPLARAQAAEPDSSLSETVAGQALHRLTYATAGPVYPQLRPPRASYRGMRLMDPEEAGEVTGIAVEDWARALIEKALAGGAGGGHGFLPGAPGPAPCQRRSGDLRARSRCRHRRYAVPATAEIGLERARLERAGPRSGRRSGVSTAGLHWRSPGTTPRRARRSCAPLWRARCSSCATPPSRSTCSKGCAWCRRRWTGWSGFW